MKKLLLVLALMLVCASAMTTRDLIKELSKSPNQYSATIAQYKIGTANLYLQGYNGMTYSYYLTNGQLHLGRLLLPKFEIWTTEGTLDSVLASPDPQAAASYAIKNGMIRIRATNLLDTLIINTIKAGLFAGPSTPPANPPGTWVQRAAGGPCGPIQYRTIPMGQTMSFIAVCAEPMVCQSGYCLRKPPATQPGTKRAGEKCNHAGECATGHCVKAPYSGTYGSSDPATFFCSCEEFRFVTIGC